MTTQQGLELKALIEGKRFEQAALKRGTVCKAMMTRGGKIHRPVEMAWRHYPAADSRLYRAEGADYYIVGRCGNPVVCEPAEPTKPRAIEKTPAAPPAPAASTPVLTDQRPPAENVYGLRINFFRDREDGYWWNRYREAKRLYSAGAYWHVFVNGATFQEKVKERESRPIEGGIFHVRFWSGYKSQREPGKLVHSLEIETKQFGFGYVPIPPELLARFTVVDIVASAAPDIIERYIYVSAKEIERVRPANVWFVSGRGVD